jgi:glycosyltransferase involved in cell wall biosynthesis
MTSMGLNTGDTDGVAPGLAKDDASEAAFMDAPAEARLAKDHPLVSVVIPAFNVERFIGETLDAVLQQTYDNFEVIVVDDGSTDRTAELVREYSQRDPRIRLYLQSNLGPSEARNTAIAKSRGQFIAPLDADDIWYPEKLQKQVDCMLRFGPNTGVVYSWTAYLDEQGSLTGGFSARTDEGRVFLRLLCSNFIATGSVPLIRRSCFAEVGGYRPEFVGLEDKELYLRIAEKHEFRVVPEFLVGYRQVRGSTSHAYARIEECHKRLTNEIRRRHPEIPATVYRWWDAVGYTFIATRSLRSRQFGSTIRYLMMAIFKDPTVVARVVSQKWLQRRSWRRSLRIGYGGTSDPHFRSAGQSGGLTLKDIVECASRSDGSPLSISKQRRLEHLEARSLRRAQI